MVVITGKTERLTAVLINLTEVLMPTFHPLIYSVRDGAAMGQTIEAVDANEAVRHVAAAVGNLTLPEVDRAFARREFKVIAVLAGDPKFVLTTRLPLFPAL